MVHHDFGCRVLRDDVIPGDVAGGAVAVHYVTIEEEF